MCIYQFKKYLFYGLPKVWTVKSREVLLDRSNSGRRSKKQANKTKNDGNEDISLPKNVAHLFGNNPFVSKKGPSKVRKILVSRKSLTPFFK